MKKLVLFAIPATLAVILFVPISNRVIYYSLFALLFVFAYLFHIMEDVVPLKAVEENLGSKDFFCLKCGYISVNGQKADLVKGLMVIYSSTVLFYVRAGSKGGAKLAQTIPGESIESYAICKVDDFHPGIVFTLNGGDEAKFTSKKFSQVEAELRKALGWPEEEKSEPDEDKE